MGVSRGVALHDVRYVRDSRALQIATVIALHSQPLTPTLARPQPCACRSTTATACTTAGKWRTTKTSWRHAAACNKGTRAGRHCTAALCNFESAMPPPTQYPCARTPLSLRFECDALLLSSVGRGVCGTWACEPAVGIQPAFDGRLWRLEAIASALTSRGVWRPAPQARCIDLGSADCCHLPRHACAPLQ